MMIPPHNWVGLKADSKREVSDTRTGWKCFFHNSFKGTGPVTCDTVTLVQEISWYVRTS